MKLIMISIMHAIFTCLIINDSVNSLYVARGGPGNIVMSSAIPLTQIHTSHTIPSSDAVYDLSSSLKRINKKQELNVQTSLIRSKISNRVGKLSIIEKLTFSWVRGLMVVGNKRPLEYSDMWGLSSTDMEQASANFSHYFNIERNNEDSSMSNHINTSTTVSSSTSTSTSDKDTVVQGAPSKGKPNILAEFWQSAITRTIVKMYRKEFIHTGILKFFNTFVQFFPSILISQIVSITDKGTLSNPALRMLGLGYAGLLFAALCAKTFLENQYFDEVINLSSKVKGTLSAAVYKKSLRLSPSSRQNNTVGEIVNFMQMDTARLEYVAASIHTVWDGLLQVVGYTSLLLYFLGPSVLAGMAAMLFIVPLNTYFLVQLSVFKEELLKSTDRRVKLINEVLQGIRAIKSYNWENPFADMLTNIRKSELRTLKKSANSKAILTSVLSASPSFVAVITLSVYTLLGNKLTAAKVFTALALFNQLRFPLIFLPMLLNSLAEGKISLRRLTDFLQAEETVPYVEENCAEEKYAQSALAINNSTFSWKSRSKADSVQNLGSLGNVNIDIKKGELIAVVGPVGSGKSSLLSAILGDMHKDIDGGRVIVNGEIAYVPQTSWIPNDTLRNVVLFGRSFNESKYRDTVHVCNLEKDLTMLDSGDQTEIGEKGVNLSGGQKQRLSIARAVYEDADIYLFDDPLSALDAEVGKQVFNDCIKSALHDKTRILVTHQLSVLTQVDRVILMEQKAGGECVIADQGKLQDLLRRGHDLSKLVAEPSSTSPTLSPSEVDDSGHEYASSVVTSSVSAGLKSDPQIEIESDSHHTNTDQNIITHTSSASTTTATTAHTYTDTPDLANVPAVAKTVKALMTKEEKAEGAVSGHVYATYVNSANKPILLGVIVASFFLSNACQVLQQWTVGAWTSDVNYVKFPLHVYLGAISGLATGVALFTWVRAYLVILFGAAASLAMHNRMVTKVLSAPLGFFESTPVGRLIQRFSKDMDQIDQQLPGSFSQLVASFLNIAGALVTIAIATPSFALVMGPIMGLYVRITSFYRHIARELKRIESISRSPVYQQFTETLLGLQVIRSFKRQRQYERRNEVALDDNLGTLFSLKSVDRWLSVRLELLGNSIVFCAALLAVLLGSKGGPAGMSLSNALSITSLLNWAVRNGAETESYMNSVERILYTSEQTPSEKNLIIRSSEISKRTLIDQTLSQSHTQEQTQAQTQSPKQLLSVESDAELRASGWPWHGSIELRGVKMRYRDDFDPVLRDVNLSIQAGESLGIVGRTGSGKSTIFRILLRLSELEEGQIRIDGVDISKIGLDTLRSCISIIPQDAVLFSGSVRMNLDPFGQHKDEELWSALRKSHAANMIQALPGGLDYSVSEGGENFSAGQRQLLCLARALVRKSKILILDEATSSIDHDTDKLIQATIREEFGHGKCTVLTIAHRLDSIIDSDRILVMSGGRVGEIGTPQALLRSKSSLFSQLVAADRKVTESVEAIPFA